MLRRHCVMFTSCWTGPAAQRKDAELTSRQEQPVRVVHVAGVMSFTRRWLTERLGARDLADVIDPACVEVAVVGGSRAIGVSEMDGLPDLRAIVSFGVGYDNFDIDEAHGRGIVVSNTSDVLADAVADFALVLVLDVLRGISAADRFVRRGGWAVGEKLPLTRDVRGSTIGIRGLGRIGTAAAQRLELSGTTIRYRSRSAKEVSWAYATSLDALVAASDVLVVLTPGDEGTERLVDAAVLDALRAR